MKGEDNSCGGFAFAAETRTTVCTFPLPFFFLDLGVRGHMRDSERKAVQKHVKHGG